MQNCFPFKRVPTDFTRIENLIAKTDEEHHNVWHNENMPPILHPFVELQHQNLNNGWQNVNISPILLPFVKHNVHNTADFPRAEPDAQEIFRKQAQPTKTYRGYSDEQLRVLNERIKKSKNISIEERNSLSKAIGLTPNQIKNWFENRRYKRIRGAAESPKKTNYKYYSRTQTRMLEERFAECDRIRLKERREMGVKIDLSESQIKYWFQNRHKKVSRDARKAENSQTSR